MPAWFDPLKSSPSQPAAQWIWPAQKDAPAGPAGARSQTALFHRRLDIPTGTVRIELHLSAEGRYTLWVNEEREPLGRGPARSDFQHRPVDTYDLEVSGATVNLWLQVRWWAGIPEAPLGEMPGTVPGLWATALFFDGQGGLLGRIGTDRTWWASHCPGLQDLPITDVQGYVCIGQAERHVASGWPGDWRKDSIASPAWQPAQELGAGYFRGDPDAPWGTGTGHGWLVPREIAFPEEWPVVLRQVQRVGVSEAEKPQDLEKVAVKLAAGERIVLRCDAGEEVLAYLRLTASGAGLHIRITGSEVVRAATAGGEGMVERAKRFSLDTPGTISGIADEFILDRISTASGATAAPIHTFETAHWRAFRFLHIEAAAGEGPAEIHSLELLATGYPFERDWSFEGGGEAPSEPLSDTLHKIADVSWRTLRRCAWDTYMDCPYYEQLQYIGDTRLQCLLTYITTGDLTLPAQALRAFDRSRLPEGLTQSRYPCSPAGVQIIPTFSLLYILMIEDYLVHSGDEALVAELRPGIAPILNWFSPFMDADSGVLGSVPFWPFVDWVEGWDKGMPPHGSTGVGGATGGSSSIVNLTYLLALQSSSAIYERTKAGSGNFYATRASALRQRIYDVFYDAGRGLLCDIPLEVGKGRVGVWSQHAQALGVLTGTLSTVEGREAMAIAMDPRKLLLPGEADPARARQAAAEGRFLSPATLYFRFYLAEALAKLRMGDEVWALFLPFREALSRGSTTWPESLEPARSECHAWGSWPLFFIARHLLGIAPPAAEDGRVRIHPLHCRPIDRAKGRFMTHRGPVDVEVRWENGKPQIRAAGAGVEIAAH